VIGDARATAAHRALTGALDGASAALLSTAAGPIWAPTSPATRRLLTVLRTLPLAVAQVTHPSSRRVLVLSVLATLGLLVALVFGVGWLLAGVAWFGIGWLDSTLNVLGTLSAVVLAWLLLPGVLAAMTAMLVDPVADAVEQRYYPGLPAPRPGALADGLRSGLKLALLTVLLNLVLLPLLFVPPVYLVLFYGLNGYLVARGYFEQVAVRRVSLADARAVFANNRMNLWLSGIILTFVTTVPIVNLVVPILATAWMTHATQELRAR
jgi:uncharacterized protein involved in cysteine biosynthesis